MSREADDCCDHNSRRRGAAYVSDYTAIRGTSSHQIDSAVEFATLRGKSQLLLRLNKWTMK